MSGIPNFAMSLQISGTGRDILGGVLSEERFLFLLATQRLDGIDNGYKWLQFQNFMIF